MKVIIWGYPLESKDTLSYVWNGFYRAFKALGHEVYWFHDDHFPMPDVFDYNNCLFLAEQYKCVNMPLFKTSTYLIHTLIKPEKYFGKVKRLIDLRYSCDFQAHPVNYNYVMDRHLLQNVGPLAWYDNQGEYDKIYLTWATNLLPDEIDFDDLLLPKDNTSYFIGTVYDGEYENRNAINEWKEACDNFGIKFFHIDPWRNPVTDEQNRQLINSSWLSPDLRGPQNIQCGYIPCRIFKNISYGQLGLTNSLPVHEALNYTTIYHPDIYRLFEEGNKYRKDNKKVNDRIRSQMITVKRDHTFINRVNSIMEIL